MPHLWYTTQAEEAARFYAEIILGSHVDTVTVLPAETPAEPPGSVTIVAMMLAGAPVLAISAGDSSRSGTRSRWSSPCDTQAEIDRIWDRLVVGGTPQQCGWLRDGYGLCWQIVPGRSAS